MKKSRLHILSLLPGRRYHNILNKLLYRNILVPTITFVFLGLCSDVNAIYHQGHSEYKIKAVYIYNFLLFSQWPNITETSDLKNIKEKDDPIIIGIVGKDPFYDYFKEVEGKLIKSKGMRLKIIRFGPFSDKINLRQCHLLYISASEKQNMKRIIAGLYEHPTLTVSDYEGFLESGGMIKLIIQNDKVRWEMNKKMINVSGLRISAQLFRSAVKVVEIPFKNE